MTLKHLWDSSLLFTVLQVLFLYPKNRLSTHFYGLQVPMSYQLFNSMEVTYYGETGTKKQFNFFGKGC